MAIKKDNLQIKLSLDPDLKEIWEFLKKEYKGLANADIVRLALNNLAKESYHRPQYKKFRP